MTEVGYAARVRVQARQLGTGWHAATIGRVGETCMVAMVGEPADRPVRFKVVDFSDVTEMLVSDPYNGLQDPNGTVRKWTPAADTTREQWRKVDLDTIREKHGNCSPQM
jgi:hypothetical protein